MAATSANYATVIAACRRCLANGTSLTGSEIQLVIDVVQHGSSNERDAAADALEALLVTHIALWVAVGAGDTSTVRTNAVAALVAPRAAAIAGAAITDIAASDGIDGRFV
jgi:hypothetical protein